MQRFPGKPFFSILAIVLIVSLTMIGCGGGGGGGDVPDDKVTLFGKAEDGTGNSIENAECGFKNLAGSFEVRDTANANGKFTIQLAPGKEGYLECHPPNMPKLILSTFVSTTGRQGGDTISETLTPHTTVVSNIIIAEDAEVPLARKTELNHFIQTGQDDDLNLITTISAALYQAMYEKRVDVEFSAHREERGDGPGGDGGGVGGDGGDGAAASPIADARCEFIIDNDLVDGSVLYSAAIADFLDDGELSRPDLVPVRQDLEPLFQSYTPEEIQSAFEAYFEEGIGEAYIDDTDNNGEYFIANPPNVPGFVRCYPRKQETPVAATSEDLSTATYTKLFLTTYVPARSAGEELDGQSVNPATTYFSHKIASKLTEDVDQTKDNYIDNISELGDIQIEESGGTITRFYLHPDVYPGASDSDDEDVTMVAFSAATLFNVLYKNGEDLDYLEALDDLVENRSLTAADFQDLGIPATQAAEYEAVFNTSIDDAEEQLQTSLDAALSRAVINVTVTETTGGAIRSDAVVDITDAPSGVTWDSSTDSGTVTFEITGLSSAVASITVEASGVSGYLPAEETVDVVATANIDIEIAMQPAQTETGSLRVNLSPAGAVSAGAQWRVDGGTWHDSGDTQSNLTEGNHTVTFRSISGWSAPSRQTVTITRSQTTTASGEYIPIYSCGTQQVAGGDTPDTRLIEMGATSGIFNFTYETYSIKDRMIVRYGNTVLHDTDCVGEHDTIQLDYSGSSTQISVQVIPNCGDRSGTSWYYQVTCVDGTTTSGG